MSSTKLGASEFGSLWKVSLMGASLALSAWSAVIFSVLEHVVDDEVAATQRALGTVDRRVGIWGLGQPGEDGGFVEGEIFSGLVEIEMRTSLEAINAVAEVDLVAVHGEDLFLGEAALDLKGEHDLLHLAPEVAIGGEEQVAGELHGEGGRTLGAAAGADVAESGAAHAPEIDAEVGLEILVFGRDDGVAQDLGEIFVAADHPALQGEGADDAALVVVELRDGAGAELLELGDLRKVGGVDKKESAADAEECRGKNEQAENYSTNQLPAADFHGRKIVIKRSHVGRGTRSE